MISVLLNFLIVFFFIFLNPVYALFISALINFSKVRINFFLFTSVFSLSFCLLYFLKDYHLIQNWSDFALNLNQFYELQNINWGGIVDRFLMFPAGNEPLFWFYVKFFSSFISNNNEMFTFFHYFITFILFSFLAKAIDKKHFVIVLACLLFTNFGLINNAQEIWRHTFAFSFLMIGLVLMGKKNRLSRTSTYISFLFHFSTLPIIIFYETFCLFMKNDRGTIPNRKIFYYLGTTLIAFIVFTKLGTEIASLLNYERLTEYYKSMLVAKRSGYQRLFNIFSFLVFIYLWINWNQLTKSELFIGTQYFLITILLIQLPIPEIFQRFNYYVVLLGSIIIAKMMIKYMKAGFLFILFLFIFNVWSINYNPLVIEPLAKKWHAKHQNFEYGLGKLLFNYKKLHNFNF